MGRCGCDGEVIEGVSKMRREKLNGILIERGVMYFTLLLHPLS